VGGLALIQVMVDTSIKRIKSQRTSLILIKRPQHDKNVRPKKARPKGRRRQKQQGSLLLTKRGSGKGVPKRGANVKKGKRGREIGTASKNPEMNTCCDEFHRFHLFPLAQK